MNAMVNMQQRRTIASGRQDPNKTASKNELISKKISTDLENSIHEVLSLRKSLRKKTTELTRRGRQMVLAALHKKQATESSPPASKNELTSSTDLENSIHEVLSLRKSLRKKTTELTRRGRQMVLAELHKKQATESSPPASKNELTSKKISSHVENSIHEVLSVRKDATELTRRGRQMVLAALHKKQATENSPPGFT